MHSAFADVSRHHKQLATLSRLLEAKSSGHALCLTGPDRACLRGIAERFAAAVLGVSPLELSRHPDVIRVADVADGDDVQAPTIDDIRAACERLQQSAMLGTKVAILENVHLLRHDAQNALLKTLEEPSGKVVIILLADDARGVLATILSRTTHIVFPHVALDALTSHPELRERVAAFLALPAAERLMSAGSLVKGDNALSDTSRDAWLALLAAELRATHLPRGDSAPLRAILDARESLLANGNPTLAFEHIALALSA